MKPQGAVASSVQVKPIQNGKSYEKEIFAIGLL
jgi:hypothetical protein